MRKIKLFLIILIISSISAYGQSPGGVAANLGLWVKADNGFTPSLWLDKSENGYDLTQNTATLQPVLVNAADKFNFNPAINFDSKAMGNANVVNRGVGVNNSLSLYSVASLETDSGANTLFGVGGNGDNPHLGAYPGATFMMWTSLYGTAANPAMTMSKSYLMSGHWQHAVAGTARIELNGFAARTGGNQSSPPGNFVIGNDFINAANQPWRGLIPEVIVYTYPKSGNENQRVNSYLGIKYGLTLRTGGVSTGTFDYLSSASANVWNGTANSAYHNNVFGIARDDAGALYQKQSKSVNQGQKLIIGTGSSLFNMNSSNANTLTNGQFLVAGDNGLKQSLVVSLSYPDAPGGELNYRFASVWKVQNTGNTGTVIVAWPKGIANLNLVRSDNNTFDTSDDFIPMTGEVTVNGVVYNTATVNFNDGDYFTFAGYGTAPGGVFADLGLWTKADDGFTPALWLDKSGNNFDLTQSTATLQPVSVNAPDKFNFNPAVNFDNKAMGNNQIANRGVNNSLSLYSVASLETDSGANTLIGIGAAGDNPHFGAYPNATFMMYTSLYGTAANPAMMMSKSYLMSGHWQHAVTGTARIELNGFSARTGGTQSSAVGNFVVGNDYITSISQPWRGLVPEVIAYTNPKSGNENQRVNSYLGIKYGLTLRTGGVSTGTFDYLSSASVNVWNGTTNSAYHNNVFGIGRDDISVLSQKVSKSVNNGTILTMATNNDFVSENLDASRTAISDDQQFFIAGDNNDTDVPLQTVSLGTSTGKIIQRKWLSQRTGTLGVIYFQTDLSIYESQFNALGSTPFMIIADDAAYTVNRILIVGTKVGSKWIYNHNFDSENTKRYFTFGVLSEISSGCYKPGATDGTTLDSKVGITALSRAGADNVDNWPMTRKGAWLVLESKSKGFVPNRVSFNAANHPIIGGGSTLILNSPVEGMMVYDKTNKCLKVYTTKDGDPSPAWHCMSTQACDTPSVPKTVKLGYWADTYDGVTNLYALGGTGMPVFNSQLTNSANYGLSGTYNKVEGFDFQRYTTADLNGTSGAQLKTELDVFCIGVANPGDLDAATVTKIKDFSDLGGVVIVFLDNTKGTPAFQGFGGTGTVGGGGAYSYTIAGTTGSNGVFGIVPGNTLITGAQTMGRVSKTQLPAGSEILASEASVGSTYAGIWITGTSGRVIFFWDEGVFRNGSVSGITIDTAQEKYLHNIMAYALDKLP